jgi:hypothetical protein
LLESKAWVSGGFVGYSTAKGRVQENDYRVQGVKGSRGQGQKTKDDKEIKSPLGKVLNTDHVCADICLGGGNFFKRVHKRGI